MNYTRVTSSGEQLRVEVRTLEEEIDFWLGVDEDGFPDESDPFLGHLTDTDIFGLGDSYDDPRIDTVTTAYIALRQKLRKLSEILEAR